MKVLIAVDASETAEKAFDWYFAHMHKDDNFVIIGHIAEQPQMYQPYFGGVMAPFPVNEVEELIKKSKKEVRELMLKYEAKIHKDTVKHQFVFDIVHCAPGEALIHLAEKDECDIIITGSRGLGAVRRTILGSVSDYVLHHAKIPVLVCHK
uniref:UspA domain-containing protein n=1 Tax=Ciona savignyi TaxID=51511 RepID=H2YBW3_CIOSA